MEMWMELDIELLNKTVQMRLCLLYGFKRSLDLRGAWMRRNLLGFRRLFLHAVILILLQGWGIALQNDRTFQKMFQPIENYLHKCPLYFLNNIGNLCYNILILKCIHVHKVLTPSSLLNRLNNDAFEPSPYRRLITRLNQSYPLTSNSSRSIKVSPDN